MVNNHGFTASAIEFIDPITEDPLLYTGRRHHDIIKDIHDDGFTEFYKKTHVDGFIYKGKFISREEATKIAKDIGIKMTGSVLTSEDLW